MPSAISRCGGSASGRGLALASRRNLDLMAAAGAPIGRMVATGGGAKGSLWLRIKASVYGVPIAAPESTESGLLGCAALAGVGTGLFADPRDAARRLVRLAPPVEPDPALADRYARLGEVFADVYAASRAFDERLKGL